MHNEPGHGQTRHDKTTQRMEQERKSPGATSAGGHGADAPDNDTSADPSSSQARANLNTSANTAARRGDSAATESTDTLPPLPPAV